MFADSLGFQPRDFVRRFLAPLVAWIPDVSTIPPRRMVAIGAGISLAFHLLLLLLFLVSSMVFPHRTERAPEAEKPRPLEVQLVPMPNRELAARHEPKRTELLSAKGLNSPEAKPESPDFESDKDTVAATENQADGMIPLPSQDGRTDLPGHDFATQDVRIGIAPSPESAAAPSKEQAAQPAAAPAVSPMYKPQPVAKEELKAAETAKPIDQLPEPAKPIRATPPPFKFTDRPDRNSMEIARATTPEPRPAATPRPVATPAPTSMAMLTTPQTPASSITSRYQESLQKSRVEGGITNRGKASVNQINTPMGRYHRRMCQQIESLWTLKTHEHPEMLNLSTVRVRYYVASTGRIENIEVLSDGGDRRHAQICVDAIRALKLDPLPPEATPLLNDGALEMVFSFTLF